MKASVFARPEEKKINQNLKMNQTKLNRKTTAASGRGDFAALIGLDWASQRHALCLYDCATGKRENSTLEHTPEAIAQWAQGLEGKRKSPSVWNRPRVRSFMRSWSIPSLSSIRSTRPRSRAIARPLKPAGPRMI